MILDKFVALLPFIIPILFLGNNMVNVILLIISSMYIFTNLKNIKYINRKYVYVSIGLLMSALISIILVDNNIYAISGMALYLNLITYYIVFQILKSKYDNLDQFTSLIIYTAVIINTIYLLFQLCIKEERLSGIFGYANTEGIFLISILLLNKIKEPKYSKIINVILLALIFATGSRTSWLLLTTYIIVDSLINKKLINILELLVGGFIYILIAKLSIVGFLISPIVLSIYNSSKKIKNKHIIIISILFIMIIISSSSNTIERFKNISLQNGSLQERLITFEDGIESIKNNPLGQGIDTYNFKSYKDSSAFYSQRYMHNSLLSIGYEMGIIGVFAFIIFIIICNLILIKNKEKRYLIIVDIIFLHSLLDFDFVFSPIFILISFIISNYGNDSKESINICILKPMLAIMVLLFSYIGLYEGCLKINTMTSLSIASKMYKKDYRANLNLSSIYIDNNDLYKCLQSLSVAENLSSDNPFIKWNLSYIYKELGEYDKALEKASQVLEMEKYNKDVYVLYNDILKNKYDAIEYNNKLKELKTFYYKSLDEINPKSKYLKNQLPNKFEYAIDGII